MNFPSTLLQKENEEQHYEQTENGRGRHQRQRQCALGLPCPCSGGTPSFWRIVVILRNERASIRDQDNPHREGEISFFVLHPYDNDVISSHDMRGQVQSESYLRNLTLTQFHLISVSEESGQKALGADPDGTRYVACVLKGGIEYMLPPRP